MEQVDEQQRQAAAEVDAVHHQQNNSVNNHYAGLTQALMTHTSKSLTTSMSYFQPPQPPELDYPIYSSLPHRFFFNSNTHNNQDPHPQHQQQQQPYHEVDGVGTTSTYLAAAGGLLLESCSAASEATAAAFNYGSNNNCSSSRWPREETMSLLQIRSRLHSNFKQATHKGPLWDEVSRIMYEEHGYQRSGKKCREKFENLYKYYKKTKEAKSGKHDGKNYRFFRQLEALYGDQNEVISATMTEHLAPTQPTTLSSQTHFPPNPADSCGINNQIMMMRRSSAHLCGDIDQQVISPNNHHNNMKLPCDQSCLSLSNHNSSLFTSSSSEDNKRGQNKKQKLKVKIKEFIDTQMKSLMEKQQFCMEKVMEAIEKKEKERVLREEEWRQEAEERLEKEHKYWENERAWMKARDAALMETIQKLTAGRSSASSSSSLSARDIARVTSLASHMQQIPFSSPSSVHPGNLMNKQKPVDSSLRNPPALYNNQESQDGWLMGANHHHHHHHESNNGSRFMMSDGNGGGSGGSLLWDGSSSFGLKLNNGDDEDDHQN